MKKLHAFFENLLGVSIAMLFLLVLFQVVARVILRIPTSWSVEMGRIFFAVIVFFGSGLLIFENRHMKITTLQEIMPRKMQKVVQIINHVLVIGFLFSFTYGSYGRAMRNMKIVIPTLEWMTTGYLYLLVMFSGLLMLIFSVREFIHTIRGDNL